MSEKPRLVQVTDQEEYDYLNTHRIELSTPACLHWLTSGGKQIWCDPDELAQWRAGRKTLEPSEVKP
jgi:hypothetical protein